MKNEHSWTRQWYDRQYRWMRRGIEPEFIEQVWSNPAGTWRAADYSFQARDYEVHGWVSDLRRKRFYQIFWRVVTARGELPF